MLKGNNQISRKIEEEEKRIVVLGQV
jgi:hypothetical protein